MSGDREMVRRARLILDRATSGDDFDRAMDMLECGMRSPDPEAQLDACEVVLDLNGY